MVTWAEFSAAAPEFAARVETLLQSRKHKTMATLRADGSPRISGTETQISDGLLTIGSMPGAVKARDLLRDPRVAIHGPTVDAPEGRESAWAGEAKVAGVAVVIESPDDSHRFAIDVREVVLTRLNEAGDALVIESWHDGRGYARRERA
jgi:hypothetical protein